MATTDKKPGILSRVARSFRDTRGEMKKVVWPSRKQTINNTGVVMVFMVVMAIIVGAFDLGLGALVNLFFGS